MSHMSMEGIAQAAWEIQGSLYRLWMDHNISNEQFEKLHKMANELYVATARIVVQVPQLLFTEEQEAL